MSLAAMELIAHAAAGLLRPHLAIPCHFDESLAETLNAATLPREWNLLFEPAWTPLQLMGDAWVKSVRSAVLKVPSAVVPAESNYLLNSAHPEFVRIAIGKPQRYRPDPRILSRTGLAPSARKMP